MNRYTPIKHEQNIIGSLTQLDNIAYKEGFIALQLFTGHMVGSWQMKKIVLNDKTNLRFVFKTKSSGKSTGLVIWWP